MSLGEEDYFSCHTEALLPTTGISHFPSPTFHFSNPTVHTCLTTKAVTETILGKPRGDLGLSIGALGREVSRVHENLKTQTKSSCQHWKVLAALWASSSVTETSFLAQLGTLIPYPEGHGRGQLCDTQSLEDQVQAPPVGYCYGKRAAWRLPYTGPIRTRSSAALSSCSHSQTAGTQGRQPFINRHTVLQGSCLSPLALCSEDCRLPTAS